MSTDGKHRGGRREGAGRPKGSGKYGEETKAVRVPVSRVESILSLQHRSRKIPFFESAVAAGIPTFADAEMSLEIDLNEFVIKNPLASFFVRVSGDSMINAGIYHNDILVVDRSVEPKDGKVVIAAVNGELTVKRLSKKEGQIKLMAENEKYPPIVITEGFELHIWGVVTSVIHFL